MIKPPAPKIVRLVLVLLVLSLSLLACKLSPTAADPTATALPPTLPPQPAASDETPDPLQTPSPSPTAENLPINPTPTINFDTPNPVQLSELQFIQEGNDLVILAKFRNTLSKAILRDVPYEVLALDENGNRIAWEAGSIAYLFPEETSALARRFDLMAGAIAKSVEVSFGIGVEDKKTSFKQPFELSKPAFFADSQGSFLTAGLENLQNLTYTEVSVNAIAYNAAGEMVGGGSIYAEFVPAKDEIGLSVPALLNAEPTRVEFYPWLSGYSAALEGGSWWKNVKIQDWNFVITPDRQIGGGAVLTNITDRILTGTYYIITVTDAQGRVCMVQKDFINFMLPGETLNFSPGILKAPDSSTPANIDLIIVPGEFGDYDLAYNPLVSSQPSLFIEEDSKIARLTVTNNLNASISSVLVTALVMDQDQNIIGGGQVYSGMVPANGSIQVDIPVIIVGELENLWINSSATLPPWAVIGQ